MATNGSRSIGFVSVAVVAAVAWAAAAGGSAAVAPPVTGEVRGRISIEGSDRATAGEPDVVVYLTGDDLGAAPAGKPAAGRVMDQVDYTFVPRLLAVVAGEEIQFQNNDSIAHNIHSSSMGRRRNRDFNRNQRPGQVLRTTFEVPDSIRVVCDIHSQMLAHIFVLPNRYFTLARVGDEYRIAGIPAGRHQVNAWHEDYGFVTREVEIRPGTEIVVDLEFRW